MAQGTIHNRRDLCLTLAMLSGLGALPEAVTAQSGSTAAPKLDDSELFSFETLSANRAANGVEVRPVTHGELATGEYVEVHETTLPPGEMPHPPHRHTHSELLLVRDGRLEVVSAGHHGFIEAGDVAFTASGVLHSLKNVGATPAHYFVVAVGIQKSLS